MHRDNSTDQKDEVGKINREAKNFIQATGDLDAAVRVARLAEEYEVQKDLGEAIKMHGQAANLYGEAAMGLKLNKGHERTVAELSSEKELMLSLNQLAKTHMRQKKFLELRQKDPDSLFDVADIRARLAPKRRALQDKKMREKGLIVAGKGDKSRSDSGKLGLGSNLSQNAGSQGEAHLPGEITNPDEQQYQFVAQKSLVLAQRSIRDTLADVQTEVELQISSLTSNTKEINSWVAEAANEQKRLMLKRSRITAGNDPFLKAHNTDADGEEVLGPNSYVRVQKSQLDHLVNSLKNSQFELESLKKKVEASKKDSQASFVRMNKSLVYKQDYMHDKPFVMTLHQIKQLASTPVGYGLHMLEIFDLTEKQFTQSKLAIQERMDMYASLMMQSQMPTDVNASMAPSTMHAPSLKAAINPQRSSLAMVPERQQEAENDAIRSLRSQLSAAKQNYDRVKNDQQRAFSKIAQWKEKYENYRKRKEPNWEPTGSGGSMNKNSGPAVDHQ